MIKPLGRHVLIKPTETASILQLPEQGKAQSVNGTVLAIGSAVDLQEWDVKVGDNVIFKMYAPEEFDVDGGVVYLIEAQDLMGTEE